MLGAHENKELTFSFTSKHLDMGDDPSNYQTHLCPHEGTQKALAKHVFNTLKDNDPQLIPTWLYDVIASTSRLERESSTRLARWVFTFSAVLISSYSTQMGLGACLTRIILRLFGIIKWESARERRP